MNKRRIATLGILFLASALRVRGQESPDYKITESSVNAGGHPTGGVVLSSPSFTISLDATGQGVAQTTIGNATVRIDSVLAAEVCAGGSCPCAAPGPGLVGWWSGDSTTADISGNRNGGTLFSGATFAPGLVGHAYRFDGVNDFVSGIGTPASYSFIQDTGVFTIDAWIKLDDPSAVRHQGIIGNTNTTTQKGHFFLWENLAGEQGLRIGIEKGVAGVPVLDSKSPDHIITDTSWHHVAAIGNASTVVFYVDGIAYPGSGVMGTMSSGDSSQPLSIAPLSPPFLIFGGLIDEVHIWNRALGAGEIQDIHDRGVAGVCRCTDADGDGYGAAGGVPYCAAGTAPDCNDGNPLVWSAPVEATDLRLSGRASTTLSWTDQGSIVGAAVTYDSVRGSVASLPVGSGSETCQGSGISGTTVMDGTMPSAGAAFWYLVRGHNSCGVGSYGSRSNGTERVSVACP